MAGFLCKQVSPYTYTFDSATTAGGLGTGEVRFDFVTAIDVNTMFISLFDKDNINRQDWLDGFFTSTVPGRDLLTLTYKNYTSLVIATATTATPTVVTTSVNHNLSTGDIVRISGATHTPLNGTFEITTVDADSISLQFNGADFSIATAEGAGSSLTTLDYTEAEVLFEIQGTSVSVASGIATIDVDAISGTLPADGTAITLSYNKAGLVSSKFWYGNCTRVQEGLGLCSSVNGGWVPAVTVCKEEL